VEKQLDLIAHGKANYESVLNHTLEVFKLKFLYFVKSISGMDQLFEVSFSSLADSGRPFSRCGKCRRFMKLVEAKPKRLFCSTCDETYNVPQQNGSLKLHQELKCPLDDFELVYFSAGAKGKSFVFCPYCYSNPVQAVPPLGTPTTHTLPFPITHTRQCPIPLVQRHPLQPTLQETTGATTGQMTTKAWTLRTVPPNQCPTRNPYTGPQ